MPPSFGKIFKRKERPSETTNASQESTALAPGKTPKHQRVDEYDIKEWYCPDNPTVDICFLHGLTGSRDETWTAHGATEPWPQALLPEKLPHARLLTFGYDADVIRGAVASKDTIGSLAEDFLYTLTRDRENAGALHRPIVFVVHSLGGIVCKRTITLSYQKKVDAVLGSVAASLVGVIFMGTPHSGSHFADVAGWFVAGIGFFKSANRNLLEILEKGNDVAGDIDVHFLDVCKEVGVDSANEIQIFCFYEILPLPAFGNRVVSKDSATYRQHGHTKIHANHMEIVRFPSATTPGFKTFCSILQRFMRSPRAVYLSPGACPPPPPPLGAPPDDGSTPPGPKTQPPNDGSPPADRSHSLDGSYPSGSATSGSGQQQQQHAAAPPSSTVENGSTSTACYYLPFQKNPNFVGRESVLQELQTLFFEDNYSNIALRGLGGVGKTQVANALAHWVKQNKPGYSVFWVPALSSSSFQKAYEAIAAKLNIINEPRRGTQEDRRDIKDVVCAHLSSDEAGHWLMVVDNADDPELVCGNVSDPLGEYIPRSDKGRVLITTRTAHVATSLATDTVVLNEFDLPQSKALAAKLLKRKPPQTQGDKEALDDLLRELVFLPLAITQAMAYLNVSGLSTTAYLGLLRRTEVDRLDLLSREAQDNTRYRESRHAIAATWLVSFDHLQKSSPDAVTLLGFLSQIQPKAIPFTLLPRFDSSDAGTTNIVTELCEYNFITMQGDDMLDMHSLVHMAARSWFHNSGRSEETVQAALEHVRATLPSPDYAHRHRWRLLLPHALYMVRDSKAISTKAACYLCLKAGRLLLYDDNYSAALQCFERCAAWAQGSLPEMMPVLQFCFGQAYNAVGQTAKAVEVLEHANALNTTDVHYHVNENLLMLELGIAYRGIGQYEKAIVLLEHFVAAEAHEHEENPWLLLSQHALAATYRTLGRFEKALELLEHVVRVQAYLAEDNPGRLASQFELARLYQDSGRRKEAIVLMEHVLDVRQRIYQDRMDPHNTHLTLSDMYHHDGRLHSAIQILEKIARGQNHQAEDDPGRITLEHRLAVLYYNDGQNQRALELIKHVASVRSKLREDDHDRLESEHTLAMCSFEAGHVEQALTLMAHVLQMRTALLPEDDAGRLESMHELAW
ncbi:hypothetical protein Sste5346_006212 [Sporothrix stenoceras]|uniref:NB-ARC domain-containing protein n=1 Tax=Sporothrix stenoceras TaxID=5173 RepID=A0ABR3Z0J7_9PEZI